MSKCALALPGHEEVQSDLTNETKQAEVQVMTVDITYMYMRQQHSSMHNVGKLNSALLYESSLDNCTPRKLVTICMTNASQHTLPAS